MASDFVREQYAALLDYFGEPEVGASLAVEAINPQWGGRNPQDVWSGYPLTMAQRATKRDRWHIDFPGGDPEPTDLWIGITDVPSRHADQSMITVTAADVSPIVLAGWRTAAPVATTRRHLKRF